MTQPRLKPWTPGPPLQVTVTGNTLVVTPVPIGVPKAQLERSLAGMRERYGQTLHNLAAGPGEA